MTGKLASVATVGLIGAVVFLALGVGLSGRDWGDARQLWGAMPSTCASTASTRQQITLPFITSDSLAIDLPASVRYQPGNMAEAIVSGDPTLLDHVRMEGGRLGLDCDPGWSTPRLVVSLTGPAITHWKLRGNVDLSMAQIDQRELQLNIRGSGSVVASGTAETVGLNISGSGDAELKSLTAQSAQIEIHGNGKVQVTAQVDADVSISGNGFIELFGHPKLRRSDVRGNGGVVQVP
ncbi:DUF2807 domain-containing protein [Rhizobium sp. 2YAF20]|uniref:GIN domain-containing protein n=1 Tax=Rhizobium sp. 2YAF20 TaxID=3233027 RepID=UPI003F9B3B22